MLAPSHVRKYVRKYVRNVVAELALWLFSVQNKIAKRQIIFPGSCRAMYVRMYVVFKTKPALSTKREHLKQAHLRTSTDARH